MVFDLGHLHTCMPLAPEPAGSDPLITCLPILPAYKAAADYNGRAVSCTVLQLSIPPLYVRGHYFEIKPDYPLLPYAE